MTTNELILICALLGWTAFAFAIVLVLEVAVHRSRVRRIRALHARAARGRWAELAPPAA